MWSEEELRNIEPEPGPPRTSPPSYAGHIRARLAIHNARRSAAHPHELSRGASPSVIYTPAAHTHGNFIDASYRNILAHPAWAARLGKAHTSKRQARPTGPDELIRAWCELDSANSSDALLMNIFCYPRVLATPHLSGLLGVESGIVPVFGHPARVPLCNGRPGRERTDRTEIDLRLGHLLIEAKLTENDFQFAPLKRLQTYAAFEEVFDPTLLEMTGRGVRSYQLIRGVLAAHADPAAHFCVLCDRERPDLIEAWYAIMRAVRGFQLQSRLRLLTWQEIAATLPSPLCTFLAEKYGIQAHKVS